MDNAGVSAQKQYERRLANHRKRVRRMLPLLLFGGVALGIASWVVSERFLPGTGVWIGLLVAASFVLTGLPNRQPTDAWGVGAVGERKTAKALGKLDGSYEILHDRKARGLKWNIDHIVIGPTGVFAIETKNVKGVVAVRQGHLMVGGRKKDAYIEEVWREAQAIQEVLAPVLASLERDVRPVICFHNAELPWGKTSIDSVQIVGKNGLIKHLTQGPKWLTDDQVKSIAALCDRALIPA